MRHYCNILASYYHHGSWTTRSNYEGFSNGCAFSAGDDARHVKLLSYVRPSDLRDSLMHFFFALVEKMCLFPIKLSWFITLRINFEPLIRFFFFNPSDRGFLLAFVWSCDPRRCFSLVHFTSWPHKPINFCRLQLLRDRYLYVFMKNKTMFTGFLDASNKIGRFLLFEQLNAWQWWVSTLHKKNFTV